MSTRTTGKKRTIALILNEGCVKDGIAIHFAALIPAELTSPVMIATIYPTRIPTKIEMREIKPFPATATIAIAASVTIDRSGLVTKLFFAAPARLRPITITIVPVTTGGSSQLIQPMPAPRTISPTIASTTPVATTPPSA